MKDPSVLRSAAKFRRVIENAGIPVERMIIFGSHARGTARKESDIDLAVVSPVFGKDDVEEMQMLFKKTHLADVRIEPFPLSPEAFASDNSPIVEEIRAYGIAV